MADASGQAGYNPAADAVKVQTVDGTAESTQEILFTQILVELRIMNSLLADGFGKSDELATWRTDPSLLDFGGNITS